MIWLVALLTSGGCLPQAGPLPGNPQKLGYELIQASMSGNDDRCEELIGAGANIDAQLGDEVSSRENRQRTIGWTSVRIAVHRMDLRLLRMLLDRGANPDLPDGYRYTPLEEYFNLSHPEEAEDLAILLIARGAKVNTRGGMIVDDYGAGGTTPLHSASRRNLLRVAQALVDHGANVRARTTAGWTPMHGAMTSQMVQILKKAGGDLEVKDDSGYTPLAHAISFNRPQQALALIEAGAKSTFTHFGDFYDGSLLHMVVGHPIDTDDKSLWLKVFRALLEHGADVNLVNSRGEAPLVIASDSNPVEYEEMGLMLLAHGADPKAPDHSGNSPLYHAAEQGHSRLIRELVRKGADVNGKDQSGNTPLHRACCCFRGNLEPIRALVEAGADVNSKTTDGQTPLDHAPDENREIIVPILQKK